MSAHGTDSWYLDPVVASQKREVHQKLVRDWAAGLEVRTFLKTDLFEEANGADHILFDLYPADKKAIGIDVAHQTAARAAKRSTNPSARLLVCDVRRPALRPGSLDLIVSTSTLDHLEDANEFRASLGELAALLRKGGLLIVTVDNLQNPIYPPLRWASRRGWLPFTLGYTVSLRELNRVLAEIGMEVVANEFLLHNPRVITTVVCLGLRRLLGKYADYPVRGLLGLFSLLGGLPTRGRTACFIAACARSSGPPVRPG